MLIRLKMRCERLLTEFKQLTEEHKACFYALLIAVILGFVWAFGKAIGGGCESSNVYVLIINENYGFFSFFVRTLLLLAIFGSLLFLGACQFYIAIGTFFGVTIVVYSYSAGYIASLFCDGIAGIIVFLFYYLPIFIIMAVSYFVTCARIQVLTGCLCKRNQFINIGYYKKPILKLILQAILVNFIVISILTVIIVVIARI